VDVGGKVDRIDRKVDGIDQKNGAMKTDLEEIKGSLKTMAQQKAQGAP
jgi:hypothetical protein